MIDGSPDCARAAEMGWRKAAPVGQLLQGQRLRFAHLAYAADEHRSCAAGRLLFGGPEHTPPSCAIRVRPPRRASCPPQPCRLERFFAVILRAGLAFDGACDVNPSNTPQPREGPVLSACRGRPSRESLPIKRRWHQSLAQERFGRIHHSPGCWLDAVSEVDAVMNSVCRSSPRNRN